jgi:hydrogenase/urease accessory protein HupE
MRRWVRIFAIMGLVFALLGLAMRFAQPSLAHEIRPAYLEIKETAPNRYELLWRTPISAGMRLPVMLKLPSEAHDLQQPNVDELTDSLVERRYVEVPAGLGGKRIDFVGLQGTITDVLVRVELLDGRDWSTIVRPSQAWLEISADQGKFVVARSYLLLGIEHILTGVDHLLFVSGLLLLVSGVRRLLATVSAFTLSHTITLTLATLGFVNVPPAPVEAVIALSILFVAYEVLRKDANPDGLAQRKPWLVAFSFGLLHGLGFAGGLSAAGLPAGHIPLALGFFSAGVEIGHFSFVATALTLMFLLRQWMAKFPTWSSRIPPYAIGGISAYWLITRVAAF